MECLRHTVDFVVNSLLALRRGAGPGGDGVPAPSRRVLLVVDIFLLVAILWTAFAPYPSDVGGAAGHRTAAFDARAVEPTTFVAPPIESHQQWSSNLTSRLVEGGGGNGNDQTEGELGSRRRKKRRHKKSKGKFRYKYDDELRKSGVGEDGVTPRVSSSEVDGAATHSATDDDDAGDKKDDLAELGAGLSVHNASCGRAATATCTSSAGGPPKRVVVTLSIGKRSHFGVTRVPMLAYAQRVGAELVVVDSYEHPCLARWNDTLRTGVNSHFMKLPLLQYFLQQYDQVMFLDDDVLLSPHAPNLFDTVPCESIGAVVEGYHAPGWHAMHGRSYCELYGLAGSHPETCGSAAAMRRIRIFNSGVMLLSKAHLKLLDGWETRELKCKILCDQLYMNAMAVKHGVCLADLGNAFNLPGTQVRKQLASTSRERAASENGDAPSLEGSALASSCFVHLTVLPAKPYTSHYLLLRALAFRDVMRCEHVDGAHELNALARRSMLTQLPKFEYDIQKIWCRGRAAGCQIIPPTSSPSKGLSASEYALITAGSSSSGSSSGGGSGSSGSYGVAGAADASKCAAHRAAASAADPPLAAAVSNASEVPPSARRVLHRAASSAWDCNTVVLLFATKDFYDLAINWMQQAHSIGVDNFVLVAMDRPLAQVLSKFNAPPGLLLPRVESGEVTITKLNVIGERQRFGLRVLESGFNVLFADLDALFLKSPAPILADGDIIGERIWGRPLSVVKKWGAGICTGFYFVRSTARTIAIFRHTHSKITTKRTRQPRWQASDQWAINHAVDDHEVIWQTPMPMKGISDYSGKYVDTSPAVGFTRRHRSKFIVLPHVHVARSCPILKHGTAEPPAEERVERKKWTLWRKLLSTAYALHCFPPDSMPCPTQKHGEKGCDKSVIMGSAVHIHGEVVFDQRQGLWFMKRGWEEAIAQPSTPDFFGWLRSQHNGAKPGEPPPEG